MRTLVCHGDSLTEASELEGSSIWPSLVEKRLQLKITKTINLFSIFAYSYMGY
jgi:hypothetical protein